MSDFVHLHVHTQFSLLKGSIRGKELCKRAADFGMSAVAITDYGNLFGAVDFYKNAGKNGIKPIIGCEVFVAPDETRDKAGHKEGRTYRMVLLVENATGYQNLCRIISRAYFEGLHDGTPRASIAILQDHGEGIIALSGDLHGEISQHILRGDIAAARQAALEYKAIFQGSEGGPGFYLEVCRHARFADQEEQVIGAMKELSRELDIPMVATNACFYLRPEDARAYEILCCIGLGKTVNDPDRPVVGDDYYVKSPGEMSALFHDLPEAIRATTEIAARCNFDFVFGIYHFPVYEPPEGFTIETHFEDYARRGLEERLEVLLKREGIADPAAMRAEYEERLNTELKIILQMGFPAYFLIVADFINWGKENGIPVGPGRGSAAGSLVAYSMRITDIDPLAYDLLFERFLNPERVSMPDVDVDFCQERRQEVIQYVSDKYGGRDYVCQIITFGKLQAKACIKDVGRVLDMPFMEVDRISKLIPNVINIKLKEAIDQEPRLKDLIDKEDRVARLLTYAQALEGLARHHSIHAAGVVISDKELVEYLPVASGADNEVVTQFDMKYIDDIGLVKFDFLGLKTLTQIQDCVEMVEVNHGDVLDMQLIPIDDAPTFQLLSNGDTIGVFQLESSGMREIVVKLKPEVFPDIIALVALYRPGPLKSGMVQEFIDRKHGRKSVDYPHPLAEPILKDTYGVIVYQEQVMLLAQRLAGYSLGEADLLRRAMGKKNMEEMQKQAVRFADGAKDIDISPTLARDIFNLMEKFAEYGFNKSHSAAYGFVSYQTAFLKAHYRSEFMASLMTIESANTDRVLLFMTDCREAKIEILPPDVNHSMRKFKALKTGQIRYGLCAVKAVGGGAIDAILEARSQGPFKGIFDFCERVDLKRVNRKVVESLIKSGAFDDFGHRAQLLEAMVRAVEIGQSKAKDRAMGQLNLLGGLGQSTHPPLPDIAPFTEGKRLEQEKAALGLYLSGHPMAADMDRIRKLTTATTRELQDRANKSEVRIAGIVGSCKQIMTKKGDRMAFITLEDTVGSVEVIVFSDCFANSANLLLDDKGPILVVEATIEKGDEEEGGQVKLLAKEITALYEEEAKATRRVDIRVDRAKVDEARLRELRRILESHRGKIPGYLHLALEDAGDTATMILPLPPALRVAPTPQLKEEMESLFGEKVVFFNG